MANSHTRVVAPEERELEKKRDELTTLEHELGERELESATLTNELRAFERGYFQAVGKLYAELDEVEAKIAEAQARQHPHEQRFGDRATAARAKASASAHAIGAAVEAAGDRFIPDEDLKALYREVARTIHPDLAIEDHTRARRTQLMAQANAAYAHGDVSKLKAILDDWHSSPETVEGVGVGSELVRVIRKIHQVERRLEELRARILADRQSALHRLWQDVIAAQTKGRDLLSEMAGSLRAHITAAQNRLASIESGEVL